MEQRLSGKTIIVSGGTRGMGEAVVRGIVRHGGQVAFGGRDAAAGNAIAQELGADALFVPQDVSLAADWKNIVHQAQERFGAISGLVNNAGYAGSGRLAKITDDEIHKTIAVNQIGVLLGMRELLPALAANGGGSIVNISSSAGVKAHAGINAYAGAKAAVIGMTRSAALELAPQRIRVNAIIPGFFATRLLDESSRGTGRERGAALTPLGRTAEPEEMVGPVVFLLSDESSFVTGAQLAVDGGYTA
jgi:3alpha(or 20beta)-hydroxysteroid dehydrogenase